VAKDNDGYAPLHLAVKANEHKLVQVLLGAQGRAIGRYASSNLVWKCLGIT
jgi:ankyrin repeat protein